MGGFRAMPGWLMIFWGFGGGFACAYGSGMR
jgi:hypothetical protein